MIDVKFRFSVEANGNIENVEPYILFENGTFCKGSVDENEITFRLDESKNAGRGKVCLLLNDRFWFELQEVEFQNLPKMPEKNEKVINENVKDGENENEYEKEIKRKLKQLFILALST